MIIEYKKTISYENNFCTTWNQNYIHITILWKSILYDNHSHCVHYEGWICAVSVKTGHCLHCSRDLKMVSVCSALVVLLSPAQLFERCIELSFTLVKKDLVRNDPHTKQLFNYHYTDVSLYNISTSAIFTLQFFAIQYHMKHCSIWYLNLNLNLNLFFIFHISHNRKTYTKRIRELIQLTV